ncbi:MAG: HEAT repeat domain-containing protein [Pseudomonadota bacterium]
MSDSIHDDRDIRGMGGPDDDLWDQLDQLPRQRASGDLRRRVMMAVHEAHDAKQARRGWLTFLGLPQAKAGFAMAASCVLGLLIGAGLSDVKDEKVDTRVAELELRMDAMGRELLISRLDAASPSDRLAAVLAAAEYDGSDQTVSAALLARAVNDPVSSVRAAAISSLGSGVNRQPVADELLRLLQQYDSPTVQLAIIDALLRHGDAAVVDALKERAAQQELHPALVDYVTQTTARTTT